jgi:GNAT superfamily N-acetyltransferase
MVSIRQAHSGDTGFLRQMLFEAFFWDAAVERPLFAAFSEHPEFVKLLAEWGRLGDRALIAEANGMPVGAAWFRLWREDLHSYGFVDEDTPEIAMAVRPENRSKGVGRRLLEALILQARVGGFSALSLSVDPRNHARLLYESAGFRYVGRSGTSLTMLLSLSSWHRGLKATVRRPPGFAISQHARSPLHGGQSADTEVKRPVNHRPRFPTSIPR